MSGSDRVQAPDQVCDAPLEGNFSASYTITGSRWGDLTGDCGLTPYTPPDGVVNFIDISGMVDKYENLDDAPIKAGTDLGGDMPDLHADFADISRAVDAFRGEPYPFDGPSPCP